MSKYLSLLIILILVGLGFLFFREETSYHDELVVGLESSYPPFEFMNEKGEVIGFDVDLANRLAEKLGKKLVLKMMEFEGEILSLKQGKIDLIISGMSITPSRLKEIDMIPYYGGENSGFTLVFWGKIPEGITHLEDLAGKSVSVESGSISELYLSHYPSVQVKSLQGSLAPLMDVKYGKSAANLVQADVASYLQEVHPNIAILPLELKEGEQLQGIGIGVKKGNPLFHEVEKAIKEMKESGELEALKKRWFSDVS